jgi:hypothetical protein
MRVPDKIFSQWTTLRSQGDGKKIAEQKGISEMDVSRAFTTQECSDTVFEAIADYFEEKRKLVEKYMPSEDLSSVK